MKPRAFNLHPNEAPSLAIRRLHKYIRTIQPGHEPQSRYAAHQQIKNAERHLRLVK